MSYTTGLLSWHTELSAPSVGQQQFAVFWHPCNVSTQLLSFIFYIAQEKEDDFVAFLICSQLSPSQGLGQQAVGTEKRILACWMNSHVKSHKLMFCKQETDTEICFVLPKCLSFKMLPARVKLTAKFLAVFVWQVWTYPWIRWYYFPEDLFEDFFWCCF